MKMISFKKSIYACCLLGLAIILVPVLSGSSIFMPKNENKSIDFRALADNYDGTYYHGEAILISKGKVRFVILPDKKKEFVKQVLLLQGKDLALNEQAETYEMVIFKDKLAIKDSRKSIIFHLQDRQLNNNLTKIFKEGFSRPVFGIGKSSIGEAIPFSREEIEQSTLYKSLEHIAEVHSKATAVSCSCAGGLGATSCSCGMGGGNCSVSCANGYYACCSYSPRSGGTCSCSPNPGGIN